MRPTSMMYHSSEPDDYEIEVEKRLAGYKSELSEILAKLKGGSLKQYDKQKILTELLDQIIECELSDPKNQILHLIEKHL